MQIKIVPCGDFACSTDGLVALIKILHQTRTNFERNYKL